jgi:hypothetical protein
MDKLEDVKVKIAKRIASNIGELPTNVEKYSRALLWLNICGLIDGVIEYIKKNKKGE